jgi:hypothetical protein
MDRGLGRGADGGARNVKARPAARVRPSRIRHTHPPQIRPHLFARHSATAGALEVRAPVRRNAALAPLGDGRLPAADDARYSRGASKTGENIAHRDAIIRHRLISSSGIAERGAATRH